MEMSNKIILELDESEIVLLAKFLGKNSTNSFYQTLRGRLPIAAECDAEVEALTAIAYKLIDLANTINTQFMTGDYNYSLGGKIHWRDLAIELADVWWKVNEIGGNVQHGDLDSEHTCFSVVLVAHGGQCFHGDTPRDAWAKAYKWLVDPDRNK